MLFSIYIYYVLLAVLITQTADKLLTVSVPYSLPVMCYLCISVNQALISCSVSQNPLQFGDSDGDSSEADGSDATIRNNKAGAPSTW